MRVGLLLLALSSCIAAAAIGGHILVNKDYGAYVYYNVQPSQNDFRKDPVVLWLQGGPGCSSLFGSFVENGPELIAKNGSLHANPWSWNTNATVIYIDSPVGTGYSYVEKLNGYVTNEKTLAQELYTTLYAVLFDIVPELGSLPFYIFGESYAGKYVPWLAHTILENNPAAAKKILLKGIGIGDGWVQPYYQAGSYATFLYAHNLINKAELDVAETTFALYQEQIDAGDYVLAAFTGNLMLAALVEAAGGVDVYDIRVKVDPTDVLSTALTKYLNEPQTKAKMGAGDAEWSSCAVVPNLFLLDDETRSSEMLFPGILEKIPVLLYNGDYDLICNMFGTTDWSSRIQWPFRQQYNDARNTTWIVDGKTAGYYKGAGKPKLTHLIVHDAGHMAPFNQPKNTHDMLYSFIKGDL